MLSLTLSGFGIVVPSLRFIRRDEALPLVWLRRAHS